MLNHIYIENYTIAKTLSLDFQTGLNVLTGETGAGKSIIMGAVNLALGARADIQNIRKGADRCDITLCFDLKHNLQAKNWLKEHALDDGDDCIIRRTIDRSGRSRTTLNGKPCPQTLIREFADWVLTIHSQHQHQTLLKPEFQQHALDTAAQHEPKLRTIRKLYQSWRELSTQLEDLEKETQSSERELDFLQYQLEELSALELKEDEWKTLNQEYQQLHNAKTFLTHLTEAMDLTVENDEVSAVQLAQQAIDRLSSIKADDEQITTIRTLLNTAIIHLQEAGSELNHYRDQLDISPENLALKDARLTALHNMARKHHVHPEELMSVQVALTQKINNLENRDEQIIALKKQQSDIIKQYQSIAKDLTKNREKTALKLNQTITESMQALGMTGGHFETRLEKINTDISPHGNEKTAFWVQTNPGQDAQPIQKIASGGELSRISLALQVLIATQEGTPTLIFDEVDVGIGGQTAETVGSLLRELGERAQVLCITHLAQVASQGHHHYRVEKTVSKTDTFTEIKPLDRTQRIEEIARMLSGSKISEKTLAHAADILAD